MPQRPVFRSDRDRDRVCAESLDALKLLRTEAADYTAKALALLDRALAARPACIPALNQRITLRTKLGQTRSAVEDLTTLIQCEEADLRDTAAPALATVHDRRRLAAAYGQRAALLQRLSQAEDRDAKDVDHASRDASLTHVRDLERAVQLEPDNGLWPFELGQTYAQQAERIAFEKSAAPAAAVSVSEPTGKQDTPKGKEEKLAWRQAAEWFQMAVSCFHQQLNPPHTQALSVSTPRQQGRLGKTRDAAAMSTPGALKSAFTLRSKAQRSLAHCQLRLGEVEQALRVLSIAKEQNDVALVNALLGFAHDLARDFRAATEAFQRAVEMDSRNLVYRLCLGVCLLREGRASDALAHLNEAALLHRSNAWVHYYRACACVLLGETAQGLAALTEAFAAESRSEFLLMMAAVHLTRREVKEAAEHLREAEALATAGPIYVCPFLQALAAQLDSSAHTAVVHYHHALQDCGSCVSTPASAHAPAASTGARAPASHHRPSKEMDGASGGESGTEGETPSFQGESSAPSPAVKPKGVRIVTDSDLLLLLLDRIGTCSLMLGQDSNALRYFRFAATLQENACVREEPEGCGRTLNAPWTPLLSSRQLAVRVAQAQLCGGNPVGAYLTLRGLHPDVRTSIHDGSSQIGCLDEVHCLSVSLRQSGDLAAALQASDLADSILATGAATEGGDAVPTNGGGLGGQPIDDAAVTPAASSHGSSSVYAVPSPVVNSTDVVAHCLNRAYIFYALARYEECAATASRGLDAIPPDERKSPTNTHRAAELLFLRGRASFAEGTDRDGAVASFQDAATVLPELEASPNFTYACGVALASCEGRQHEALHYLSQTIAVGSLASEAEELVVLAYHERAKLYQHLGDAVRSVADFSFVLGKQPSNFNALVRRAFALRDMGDFAAAAADWKRAESLDVTGSVKAIDMTLFYDTPFVELAAPGEEDPVIHGGGINPVSATR